MTKSYVDPVKSEARRLLREFVQQHIAYKLKKSEQVTVLCLPGAEREGEEAIEVLEIYDKLGIPRRNIVGLEVEREPWQRLQRADLGIELTDKPMSDIEFFQKYPQRRFDIVSLDYDTYFHDARLYALNLLVGQRMLRGTGVLCTNYVGRRENADTQAMMASNYLKRRTGILLGELVKTKPRLLAGNLVELRAKIQHAVARSLDHFDPLQHRNDVIQQAVYATLFMGKACLSTDYAKDILDIQSLVDTINTIAGKDPSDMNETEMEYFFAFNSIRSHEFGRNLEEKMAIHVETRSMFRDALISVLAYAGMSHQDIALFLALRTQPYEMDAAASYKYTSNSGAPMYLDMVAARDPMHRLQQYSGSLLVNDDGNTIRIRKRGKERDIKAAYRYVYGINLDNPFVVGTIVERKAIGSESPVSDGQGESLGTVTAQAETSKQKSSRVKHSAEQKHAIYQAIESNVPEDEIMNQYNLTKGQLGAFKAHVTMRNGTSHANGNGFYPDDREAMIGLLSDGHSPQEVYDLVSDKYSLPQIRGLKASLTRTKMEGLAETPLRVQILERDGYQCGICHVTEEEHRQRYNHGLHVHHIDYNPRNNDQRNQIALCVSHHAMTNTVQHAEVLKPQLEARIEEIYANVVST